MMRTDTLIALVIVAVAATTV
ncbi:MAG: hypothetical protein RL625_93, partial [Gemmatimonadota bacterium]